MTDTSTTRHPVNSTSCPACKAIGGHAPECAERVTVNPDGPPAPPCPVWCTRPELELQRHTGAWDCVDDDGHLSRDHGRSFGEHVEVTGRETSAAPGIVKNLRVYVDVEAEFSVLESLRLTRDLVAAAEWLEVHQ